MSIIKYVKGGFSILRQQGQVARPLKSCLFTCPHCILAWNVLSPPFSKADPPFGLSSSLTPIWNHYWLLDPPPSFWSNVPIFLLSAWVGVPGSSSPSWLYLTWLQGVFCLDLPFPWVVGVFFCPVSPISTRLMHWESLPSPDTACETPHAFCFFKASLASGLYQWCTGLSSKPWNLSSGTKSCHFLST